MDKRKEEEKLVRKKWTDATIRKLFQRIIGIMFLIQN